MSKLGISVPHTLTETNMEDLISIATSLLSRKRNPPFLQNIITRDEKWVFYEIKSNFFTLAAVVSIPLYGCANWTPTKRIEKKLDSICTRVLQAILNKSWKQQPTKQMVYGHLPPISTTIKVRRTRHAGHCWRVKDDPINDVLQLIPAHGCASVGRPARTYLR